MNNQSAPQYPMGVTRTATGWNFAFFCPLAKKAILHVYNLERNHIGSYPADKTGTLAHIEVPELHAPFAYHWELEEVNERLVDPFSKGILSNKEWGSLPYQPLSLHFEQQFDWEGVKSPEIEDKDLIVYEVHTRAFTQDPSSGVDKKGTLEGFIEKLPYLKELGINAIELLPIMEWNESEYDKKGPDNQEQLFNFWGYSTVHFYAPSTRLLSNPPFGLQELCKLVKAAHQNGMKVILDIVYNHTAEGGEQGPTYHFKGMDKSTFYLMDGEHYLNFSGCGNSVAANHPIVIEWIIKTLRDYVLEAHIDGFRFDLASGLKRGDNGGPLNPSPLIEAISDDPYLSKTILFAEPWDPGGLFEPGHFYTKKARWKEWNSFFRDGVRTFIKGTDYSKQHFATRMAGSKDLFDNRTPLESLNFVTCHDGFSLKDLVSYNQKHNEINGEENRDGENNNQSWNCGAEGVTDNPDVLSLRKRQLKNFMVALFVAQGVPMMLSGDEYGHTKNGNNNTWCHDNRLNWFQWDTLNTEEGQDLFRFTKEMIAYRKENPHFRKGRFLEDKDIVWHGKRPEDPRFDRPDHLVAFTLHDDQNPKDIFIVFNACNEKSLLILPKPKEGMRWYQVVNTAAASPLDILPEDKRIMVELRFLSVPAYSCIILETGAKA